MTLSRSNPVKYFVIFILAFSISAYSKSPLLLDQADKVYNIDSTAFVRIDTLIQHNFKNQKLSSNTLFFRNTEAQKSYWYAFQVQNLHPDITDWLLVSYNYAIDEIDVWAVDEEGHKTAQSFRNSTSVYDRSIVHKQPVFSIKLNDHNVKTIVIRIKNESSYNYVFALYSPNKFFSHFFKEYLLFGIFYGFMAFVIIYSILNSIFFKEQIFILYAFFIISQVVHMMFRDGTGMFLLPYYAEYSGVLKNISRGLFVIFLLLYTASFLKIDTHSPINKVIRVVIILRIAFMLFMHEETAYLTFHTELLIILFCTVLSARSYFLKEQNETRYTSIGLAIFTVSYLIYYLPIVLFPSLSGGLSFFILYYGVAGESIFMTIALGERFKRIRVDNVKKDQMNKQLEIILKLRTETIQQQKQNEKERKNFIANISHDLKTPLAVAYGYAETLVMNHNVLGTNKEEEKKYLQIICKKINQVKNLVTGLSELSKLEAAGFLPNKEPFVFAEILEESISSLQIAVKNKNISLTCEGCEEPALIFGDIKMMERVVQNLIENAIKHTPENGDILIRLTKTNNNLVLALENSGNILKNEILDWVNSAEEEILMRPYTTGLGLVIIKTILRLHNYSFSVQINHNLYNIFRIEMEIYNS